MALILTPRTYRNMKWDLTPTNIIDTVNGNAMINRVDIEPQGIYSTSTTSAIVHGNQITLPIDRGNATTLTARSWDLIEYKSIWGARWKSVKARQDTIVGSGSFQVQIDVPIEGNATIRMTPQGKTYQRRKPNAAPSWGFMPEDLDTLKRVKPWDDLFMTIPDMVQSDLDTSALFRIGSDSSYILVLAYASLLIPVDPNSWEYGIEPAKNRQTNKTVKLTPLGNRVYQIDWSCPVKDMRMAISRDKDFWGNAGNVYDWDIYMDVVTSFQFEVSGRPFNTEKIMFEYSLVDGQVTTNVVNAYPHKLDDCELITLNSTMNGKPWNEEMSRTLLTKYEKGKYIASADIQAEWMLRNNVHINNLIEIINLRGEKINRQGVVCVFEVKAIEKIFNQGSFYYRVTFLEV